MYAKCMLCVLFSSVRGGGVEGEGGPAGEIPLQVALNWSAFLQFLFRFAICCNLISISITQFCVFLSSLIFYLLILNPVLFSCLCSNFAISNVKMMTSLVNLFTFFVLFDKFFCSQLSCQKLVSFLLLLRSLLELQLIYLINRDLGFVAGFMSQFLICCRFHEPVLDLLQVS